MTPEFMARTNEGELARLAADGVAPDTLLRVPHMFSHVHSADADTS
jgi:hypothetical protein